MGDVARAGERGKPRLGRSVALPRACSPPRFVLIYFPLERPFVRVSDQSRSHWIIYHVKTLGLHAFAGS
jgi:hypothetical protein